MILLKNYTLRLLQPLVEKLVDERVNDKLVELGRQIEEIDGLAASILLEVKNARQNGAGSDKIIERLEIRRKQAST
jgi:hypothetical protein